MVLAKWTACTQVASKVGNSGGYCQTLATCIINTLRPRQNGRHFADDTFKYIFLNGNVIISAKISLKFVLKGPINNIPALVVRSTTHICVTQPQ